MPVPQTLTSGAFGFATKWSASSMHTLRFPWPAPSPRTAWPSMYAFWLMSSLALWVKAALLLRRDARTMATTCMLGEKKGLRILTGKSKR